MVTWYWNCYGSESSPKGKREVVRASVSFLLLGSLSHRLISDDIEDWGEASNLLAIASDSENLHWVLGVAGALALCRLDSQLLVEEPLIDLQPRQSCCRNRFFAILAVTLALGLDEQSLKIPDLVLRFALAIG